MLAPTHGCVLSGRPPRSSADFMCALPGPCLPAQAAATDAELQADYGKFVARGGSRLENLLAEMPAALLTWSDISNEVLLHIQALAGGALLLPPGQGCWGRAG